MTKQHGQRVLALTIWAYIVWILLTWMATLEDLLFGVPGAASSSHPWARWSARGQSCARGELAHWRCWPPEALFE
jgi:multisubunit Na+/H+ antiporter MnhE subunit